MMHSNIGGRIKVVASFFCWGGILLFVILGGLLLATEQEILRGIGLVVAIVGALVSWIGSFVLCGFGQLVENSDKLVQMGALCCGETNIHCAEKDEKIRALERWRKDGLITENEYQEKLEGLR